MIKFEIKNELQAGERIFLFDSRNRHMRTLAVVRTEDEFADHIHFEPKLTFADLAELYCEPGDNLVVVDVLLEIDNTYGIGAFEHLKAGGTVWECADDFTLEFGYGDCPYNSAYECAVKIFQGDLIVFDSIEEFISYSEELAMEAPDMSDYFECYDTELYADDLIDVDSTVALRALIVAGAPKIQIITAARVLDHDLADWLCSDIPWN